MSLSRSFWEEESYFAPPDVMIIGAGLLGLWTAWELKQRRPKLSVTLVERGVTPMGASTRNAGFACFGSPSEMLSDMEKMGVEKMWELVDMRFRGIRKIRQIIGDEESGFDRVGGFECFDDERAELVSQRLDWLNTQMEKVTGVEETFRFNTSTLEQFGLKGFTKIVENHLEGGLHSGKLVMALTRLVMSCGVRLLNGVEVRSFEKTSNRVRVFTSAGELTASVLVVASNGMLSELMPGCTVVPGRGQVLVSSPVEALRLRGTFHYDEGYYYFRNIGNRVLLGGARNLAKEEETTTALELNIFLQQKLEAFLRERILPGHSFTVDYRWSGIMAFTENKLPLISRLDDFVVGAVACNGMGVALSPIIAEELAEAVITKGI